MRIQFVHVLVQRTLVSPWTECAVDDDVSSIACVVNSMVVVGDVVVTVVVSGPTIQTTKYLLTIKDDPLNRLNNL